MPSLALELASHSGPASSCLLSRIWGLFLVLGVSSQTLLIRPGILLTRLLQRLLLLPTLLMCRAEAVMSDPEPIGKSKQARGV